MTDLDNDLNRQLLNGKSGQMTSSKNSFHSAANEILNDQKVREGRLPAQNQVSKRRTVLGKKPDLKKVLDSEKPLSKKQSIDIEVIKEQKEKNDFIQEETNNNNINKISSNINTNMNRTNRSINNNNNNINENQNNYQFKQDVLTKQAIDEIKDNIEMFKMDINRYVNELKEEQEKIELGDVKEEIKVLEDTLTKDLKDTKDQNETDYRVIKESFIQFKEEVIQLINKIVKNNELKIEALYNEIKSYEEEVDKRFMQLADRQEEYINTLKLVLETTKDKTTKQLVKQFLVDDEDIYLNNKARFEKEFEDKREKERKKLEEREKQLLAVRLKAQEKQLEKEEAEQVELQDLKLEAQNREKTLLQRREEELNRKYEELQKRRDDEEFERQMKMEEDLLNYYSKREKEEYKRRLEFMKNQALLTQKRGGGNYTNNINDLQRRFNMPNIEQSLQKEKYSSINGSKGTKKSSRKKRSSKANTNKENISELNGNSQKQDDLSEDIDDISKDNTDQMVSLKEFVKLYTPGEYGFKKFVKRACKTSIIDILKSQSFGQILPDKKDDMYSEGHSVSQSESAKERKERDLNYVISVINQKIVNLFTDLSNYIKEDNITVEMQEFFKFITTENHFVPYSFYSLFELSRISNNEGYTQKMNSNQKRMIIGIYLIIKILVYYYLIQYNFIKEEDKDKVDEDTKLNLKIVSSIIYHQFLRMVKKVCQVVETISDYKVKRQEQTGISKNIRIFIQRIEKHFIMGDPDTSEEGIEYIELKLFRAEDIQKYIDGNKRNNFSLSNVIFDFINKFYNFMEGLLSSIDGIILFLYLYLFIYKI